MDDSMPLTKEIKFFKNNTYVTLCPMSIFANRDPQYYSILDSYFSRIVVTLITHDSCHIKCAACDRHATNDEKGLFFVSRPKHLYQFISTSSLEELKEIINNLPVKTRYNFPYYGLYIKEQLPYAKWLHCISRCVRGILLPNGQFKKV